MSEFFDLVRRATLVALLGGTDGSSVPQLVVDGQNALWVRVKPGGGGSPELATTLGDASFSVPLTTATPVSATTAYTLGAYVQAHPDNTDVVYVGGSSTAVGTGRALAAGDMWEPPIGDLSLIFACSASTSQKLLIGGLA